jgi:hypothetical protein
MGIIKYNHQLPSSSPVAVGRAQATHDLPVAVPWLIKSFHASFVMMPKLHRTLIFKLTVTVVHLVD